MKRNKYIALVVFVVICFTNCDNEPYEGEIIFENNACNQAVIATNEAALSYASANPENQTNLCQAYRAALNFQIDVCGDPNGELQNSIVSLNNCITENLCDTAQAETEIARQAYSAATSSNSEERCLDFIQAIENEIEICGANEALQDIINDLGDCQPQVFDFTGDWGLVGINSVTPRDLNNDGIFTDNYLDELDCYSNETINFGSDGTGTLFYRSYSEIQILEGPDNIDNVDYIANCIEVNDNIEFIWNQPDLNTVTAILNTDGSQLDFFKNGDNIFLVIRDGFIATSLSDSIEDVVEDIIYEYVRI